ncbi:MAG: hypothetical protein ACI4UE_05420 [Candidatus Scatovivens sp.]
MENAVESILIAFAVIVFVIALSLTTFMLSKAMTTTEDLIYFSDKTNYYQNIKISESAGELTKRNVSIDTVVNSLYRYYKENFMVRIYNKSGELVQIFDTTIEGKVYIASSKKISNRTNEEKALMNNYGSGKLNLFGAPWMGNTTRDAKYRVDLYVSGKNGYINNIGVSYEGNGLYDLGTTTFEETFVEYMYSGQTISTENGIESITGNTKEKNKIIVDYKAK